MALSQVLLFAIVTCVTVPSSAEPAVWRQLLGKGDLADWEVSLGKPDRSVVIPGEKRLPNGDYLGPIGVGRDPLRVFQLQTVAGKPVLKVTGQIFGTLVSKEEYGNFHLRVEMKWGDKKWPPRATAPKDSGILYDIKSNLPEPGRSFPRSLELQLQEQEFGDLFTVALRVSVPAARGSKGRLSYDPGSPLLTLEKGIEANGTTCAARYDREKAMGEWNAIELICFEGESVHVVNGAVVLRAYNPASREKGELKPRTVGRIALQSEGTEVYFRNLEVRSIESMPAEYIEKSPARYLNH